MDFKDGKDFVYSREWLRRESTKGGEDKKARQLSAWILWHDIKEKVVLREDIYK